MATFTDQLIKSSAQNNKSSADVNIYFRDAVSDPNKPVGLGDREVGISQLQHLRKSLTDPTVPPPEKNPVWLNLVEIAAIVREKQTPNYQQVLKTVDDSDRTPGLVTEMAVLSRKIRDTIHTILPDTENRTARLTRLTTNPVRVRYNPAAGDPTPRQFAETQLRASAATLKEQHPEQYDAITKASIAAVIKNDKTAKTALGKTPEIEAFIHTLNRVDNVHEQKRIDDTHFALEQNIHANTFDKSHTIDSAAQKTPGLRELWDNPLIVVLRDYAAEVANEAHKESDEENKLRKAIVGSSATPVTPRRVYNTWTRNAPSPIEGREKQGRFTDHYSITMDDQGASIVMRPFIDLAIKYHDAKTTPTRAELTEAVGHIVEDFSKPELKQITERRHTTIMVPVTENGLPVFVEKTKQIPDPTQKIMTAEELRMKNNDSNVGRIINQTLHEGRGDRENNPVVKALSKLARENDNKAISKLAGENPQSVATTRTDPTGLLPIRSITHVATHEILRTRIRATIDDIAPNRTKHAVDTMDLILKGATDTRSSQEIAPQGTITHFMATRNKISAQSRKLSDLVTPGQMEKFARQAADYATAKTPFNVDSLPEQIQHAITREAVGKPGQPFNPETEPMLAKLWNRPDVVTYREGGRALGLKAAETASTKPETIEEVYKSYSDTKKVLFQEARSYANTMRLHDNADLLTNIESAVRFEASMRQTPPPHQLAGDRIKTAWNHPDVEQFRETSRTIAEVARKTNPQDHETLYSKWTETPIDSIAASIRESGATSHITALGTAPVLREKTDYSIISTTAKSIHNEKFNGDLPDQQRFIKVPDHKPNREPILEQKYTAVVMTVPKIRQIVERPAFAGPDPYSKNMVSLEGQPNYHSIQPVTDTMYGAIMQSRGNTDDINEKINQERLVRIGRKYTDPTFVSFANNGSEFRETLTDAAKSLGVPIVEITIRPTTNKARLSATREITYDGFETAQDAQITTTRDVLKKLDKSDPNVVRETNLPSFGSEPAYNLTSIKREKPGPVLYLVNIELAGHTDSQLELPITSWKAAAAAPRAIYFGGPERNQNNIYSLARSRQQLGMDQPTFLDKNGTELDPARAAELIEKRGYSRIENQMETVKGTYQWETDKTPTHLLITALIPNQEQRAAFRNTYGTIGQGITAAANHRAKDPKTKLPEDPGERAALLGAAQILMATKNPKLYADTIKIVQQKMDRIGESNHTSLLADPADPAVQKFGLMRGYSTPAARRVHPGQRYAIIGDEKPVTPGMEDQINKLVARLADLHGRDHTGVANLRINTTLTTGVGETVMKAGRRFGVPVEAYGAIDERHIRKDSPQMKLMIAGKELRENNLGGIWSLAHYDRKDGTIPTVIAARAAIDNSDAIVVSRLSERDPILMVAAAAGTKKPIVTFPTPTSANEPIDRLSWAGTRKLNTESTIYAQIKMDPTTNVFHLAEGAQTQITERSIKNHLDKPAGLLSPIYDKNNPNRGYTIEHEKTIHATLDIRTPATTLTKLGDIHTLKAAAQSQDALMIEPRIYELPKIKTPAGVENAFPNNGLRYHLFDGINLERFEADKEYQKSFNMTPAEKRLADKLVIRNAMHTEVDRHGVIENTFRANLGALLATKFGADKVLMQKRPGSPEQEYNGTRDDMER